jgi:hypothetical protein
VKAQKTDAQEKSDEFKRWAWRMRQQGSAYYRELPIEFFRLSDGQLPGQSKKPKKK